MEIRCGCKGHELGFMVYWTDSTQRRRKAREDASQEGRQEKTLAGKEG